MVRASNCQSDSWNIGGLVVRGKVGLFTDVLFPYTRIFTPHCLSSPRCINGYLRHTAGGSPVMD